MREETRLRDNFVFQTEEGKRREKRKLKIAFSFKKSKDSPLCVQSQYSNDCRVVQFLSSIHNGFEHVYWFVINRESVH